MELSKEEQGEIAMAILLSKIEQEGFTLKPKEVKREIVNSAKKLQIPVNKLGEFYKIFMKILYEKTTVELDKIITGKVEE